MSRKKVILIAAISATVLGLIPVIIAPLLIYRYTRAVAVHNLKTIADIITDNSEGILQRIDSALEHSKKFDTTCNSENILKLQSIAFINPEIAGIFVASPIGHILCSSLGKLDVSLPLKRTFIPIKN